MKSYTRFSKASGSTKRKVEQIIRLGERYTRRRFSATDRATLREFIKGGFSSEVQP
jgi:hypothetical protein